MTDMLFMQTIALQKDKRRQQLVSHASTILHKSPHGEKYSTFKYEYKYKYQVLHFWQTVNDDDPTPSWTDRRTMTSVGTDVVVCIPLSALQR